MSDISTIMVDTPSNDVVTEAIETNSQNNETEVPTSTKVESKKNSIDRELAVFLETNLKVLLKQNRRPAFTDKKYSKMTVVEKRETQKYVYFLYKQIRMKVEKKVNGLAEAFLVKINNYFLHKSFPISIKNMQKCCQDKIRHENDLNEDNTQPKKMEKKIEKFLEENNEENLKNYLDEKKKSLFNFLKTQKIEDIKENFPNLFKIIKKINYLDIVVSGHLSIQVIENLKKIWNKVKDECGDEDEIVNHLCTKLKTYRKEVSGIVSETKIDNKQVYIREKCGGKIYLYNSGIKIKTTGIFEAISLYVLQKCVFNFDETEDDCRFFSIFYSYCKIKSGTVLKSKRHVFPTKSILIGASYF